jgi:hypothetical protein
MPRTNDEAPSGEPPDPGESTLFESLRVLIAFDDLAAYRRALRTIAAVSRQLDEEIAVQPLPWQFETLTTPYWRDLALDEAGGAAILMVSTSRPGALPEGIRQWLQECAGSGTAREAGALLIAMLGIPGEHDGPGVHDAGFLRAIAEHAGWSFLAPGARHSAGGELKPPPT